LGNGGERAQGKNGSNERCIKTHEGNLLKSFCREILVARTVHKQPSGRRVDSQAILEVVPFTLSHAAAAWPFRRTPLELSALVTGCFAPDFPYFVFLKPNGFYGHTLPGVFLLDLPASLVALWLFHAYLKQPLTLILPRAVRRRMNSSEEEFAFWPPARLANIVLSILVGALTHIAWDSFTHNRFWTYRHLGILRKIVQLPVIGDIGVYDLLQYGSSLFGIVVVAIWSLHWYRTAKPREPWKEMPFQTAERRAMIVVIPAFAICAALVRALIGAGIPADAGSLFEFVVEAVISTITFFCVGLLACGMLLRKQAATLEAAGRR
jgi:hypothetical protein